MNRYVMSVGTFVDGMEALALGEGGSDHGDDGEDETDEDALERGEAVGIVGQAADGRDDKAVVNGDR